MDFHSFTKSHFDFDAAPISRHYLELDQIRAVLQPIQPGAFILVRYAPAPKPRAGAQVTAAILECVLEYCGIDRGAVFVRDADSQTFNLLELFRADPEVDCLTITQILVGDPIDTQPRTSDALDSGSVSPTSEPEQQFQSPPAPSTRPKPGPRGKASSIQRQPATRAAKGTTAKKGTARAALLFASRGDPEPRDEGGDDDQYLDDDNDPVQPGHRSRAVPPPPPARSQRHAHFGQELDAAVAEADANLPDRRRSASTSSLRSTASRSLDQRAAPSSFTSRDYTATGPRTVFQAGSFAEAIQQATRRQQQQTPRAGGGAVAHAQAPPRNVGLQHQASQYQSNDARTGGAAAARGLVGTRHHVHDDFNDQHHDRRIDHYSRDDRTDALTTRMDQLERRAHAESRERHKQHQEIVTLLGQLRERRVGRSHREYQADDGFYFEDEPDSHSRRFQNFSSLAPRSGVYTQEMAFTYLGADQQNESVFKDALNFVDSYETCYVELRHDFDAKQLLSWDFERRAVTLPYWVIYYLATMRDSRNYIIFATSKLETQIRSILHELQVYPYLVTAVITACNSVRDALYAAVIEAEKELGVTAIAIDRNNEHLLATNNLYSVLDTARQPILQVYRVFLKAHRISDQAIEDETGAYDRTRVGPPEWHRGVARARKADSKNARIQSFRGHDQHQYQQQHGGAGGGNRGKGKRDTKHKFKGKGRKHGPRNRGRNDGGRRNGGGGGGGGGGGASNRGNGSNDRDAGSNSGGDGGGGGRRQ
jgi:hypothetical protein